MKKFILSALLLVGLSFGAYAGYPVSAYINCSTGPGLLNTGVYVNSGDLLTISNDITDTWTFGPYNKEVNADGVNPFGLTFGSLTQNGQTFGYGTMVGRIGNNPYFLVGTSFNQVANKSGNLFLGCWDDNYSDNSGWITASVSTTYTFPFGAPLPAAAPALMLGSIAVPFFRKKK